MFNQFFSKMFRIIFANGKNENTSKVTINSAEFSVQIFKTTQPAEKQKDSRFI